MPQPTSLVEIIKTENTVEIFTNENESLEIIKSAENMVEIIHAGPRGPAGSDGLDGEDGNDGTPGQDGADGKTLLNGSGAPSAGLGVDGDFYIDTAANAIYGPKTAGVWGSPTSLIGPQGDSGPPGENGADGQDGEDGAPGPSFLDIAFHSIGNSNWTLTNAPSAEDWAGGATRVLKHVDLTNFTQVRLTGILNVIGATGTKIRLKYRTAFSGTVGNYSDIGTSEVSVALDVTPTAALDSGWINLAPGAKADVFIGPAISGGDGVADPAIGNLHAQFR